MMRSLFSAVSGLKAHQTKMDVIGNNIANVNTVAFKSQSVTFSDVYYQTTQTASGPTSDGSKGGTNAKQIGLGSTVAAISTAITSQGATERTDNTWDICLSGNSFFVINNNGSTYFTRAGDFKIDTNGALVTSGGCNVMGWYANPKTGAIVKDKVQALYPQSSDYTYTEPEATEKVTVTGNIDAADTGTATTTVSFYDSLGNRYQASLILTPGDPNGTTNNKTPSTYTVTCGAITKNGQKTNLTADIDKNVVFNAKTGKIEVDKTKDADADDNGKFIFLKNFKIDNGKDPITGTALTAPPEGTLDCTTDIANITSSIKVDVSSLTRFNDTTNLKDSMGIADATTGGVKGAGKAVGTMTSVGVDDKGCIVANYSNGDVKTIGQIAVATFSNPAGLEKVGENMYAATLNSGEFNGVGEEVNASGGKMSSGYLEMSNVDLSDQFTTMITTQRGFQANSRIITVSDTMLEELINLKR